MIPPVRDPKITEIQNTDSRLAMSDKALLREIKDLNAAKTPGSQQNAADHESLIASVLSDPDNIQVVNDVDSKLRAAWLKRQAIHEVRQSLKTKLEKAKYEAGSAILRSPEVQKAHSEIMQRLVSSLVDASKA